MSSGPAPDGHGSATADLITSGPDDTRERRVGPRWLWRIAGLLTFGVVAAVAGPDLLSSLRPQQPHAAASSSHRPAPGSWPASQDGTFIADTSWVPRGPEVGSRIVAAELARVREERPGVEGLLWAGSLDGHDHTILVSYPRQPTQSGTDAILVVALHVRRARDVATARSQTIGYLSVAGGVVGLAWQGESGHSRLLLLGRPDRQRVQVSSVVSYHPDGQISRRWRDTVLTDGFAVVDLGRRVDPYLVVRPKIPGLASSGMLVPVGGHPATDGSDRIAVTGVTSHTYAGPSRPVLVRSLSQALSMLVDLGDTDSRVLWSGQVAGGRGALVLVRRPDGARFQAFVYADQTGRPASCTANTVRWSMADRLPFAFSTNEPGAPEVLVNPGGRGTATVTLPSGARLHVRLDANGVGTLAADAAVGPQIGGAEVVVRDPSGSITLRSRMTDAGPADAFGLYL